ncbi:CAP domain-containing protein [Streptomyces sp. NPDC059649]|uniref:CAP domain-containing protein n=1 Tax=Streptomyces sp. NPDC059649 TaxID=3346895 RepID=UPI0036A752F4
MPTKRAAHKYRKKHRLLITVATAAGGVAATAIGVHAAMAGTESGPQATKTTAAAASPDTQATARSAPRTSKRTTYVRQVIALVNSERAKAGCSPLKNNARLQKAAQRHSDDMANRGFFDHTNPDGLGPGERITAAGYQWSSYGENIAAGQRTPTQVMRTWMNSTGHRENILACDSQEIGVGIHFGPGGPWWTQDFGTSH